MIHQLDQYDNIAWDFDKTLVDHPNSPLIHEYINAHPEKKHVIVTFRTHGMQKSIFEELQMYPDAPDASMFTGVINISDRAWEECAKVRQLRAMNLYKGPLTKWEKHYVEWKGRVCKQKGLQVLIDDKPDDVVPGCLKYGIAFIDTANL